MSHWLCCCSCSPACWCPLCCRAGSWLVQGLLPSRTHAVCLYVQALYHTMAVGRRFHSKCRIFFRVQRVMATGGKELSMGKLGNQNLSFFLVFFLTRPLDGVHNSCVMASGGVPSPSLGERRFLPCPKVFVMCFSIWLLQSTPSIPCSLLGFSLSPGCCLALLINSSDEWARQETNTFVTKPHRGFQRVMTLSQAICLVNALSLACL